MKKHILTPMLCNGLIFLALLLGQNLVIAQEVAGKNTAQKLEEKAWKKHESGYAEKTPEERAKAFEAAAKLFEAAAGAYRKQGNEEQAKVMEGRARASRSNAEAQKNQEQYSIQPPTSNWENISLLRKPFKPSVGNRMPRFSISLGGNLSLGDINSQYISLSSLQAAVFAPEVIEPLFKQLHGEFFIGNLSSQPVQNFELRGTTQAMPALRLGLRMGNRFELQAGGAYFQNKWSGNFPVVVFPEQQHPSQAPQTIQGTMSAAASGILTDVGLAYFFANGTLRPFVQAGVRGQFPTQNESSATLAGVGLSLETTPIGNLVSPFGGAGVQVGFMKNGFVDGSIIYSKVPGRGFAPVAMLSIGWRFGRNESAKPLAINAEASKPNVQECDNTGHNYNEDEIWAKDKDEAIKKAKEDMSKKYKCPKDCPETYTPAPINPEPFTVKIGKEKVQKSREISSGELEFRWIVKFTMKCNGSPPKK